MKKTVNLIWRKKIDKLAVFCYLNLKIYLHFYNKQIDYKFVDIVDVIGFNNSLEIINDICKLLLRLVALKSSNDEAF
ncbi:hypothetical protein AM202_02980 [Actinobacillus minor 202]|uniref:Uncharacterized protein n=1 Tax=Actinobacillus minor 202 TaxID=591023 RepID=A0ABM9YUW9_9PAST|nr:hypothetical protein AM202_02980 [Actinobacillus minor 202]